MYTVNGKPTYERRQLRRTPYSRLRTVLEQIRVPVAFLTKPGILSLLRNRLRLNDVTLSMFSLLVVLHDLSAGFSIFAATHLTDLGSKTGYRRLTSLKMSNNLLIHHAGS